MSGTARLALIAAGGTGGHMFPAQALAERLLADGWRVKLSTDDRGARYAGASRPRFRARSCGPPPRRGAGSGAS